MTALAKNRTPLAEAWRYKVWTLKAGKIAYQGAAIGFDPSTQKVQPMPDDASGASLLFLGNAVAKVDASSTGPLGSVDQDINVDMLEELTLTWYANATSGDAVLSDDVGETCYFIDDQTVTVTSSGNPVAGRIWAVDSVKGVLVEKLTEQSVVVTTTLAEMPTPPSYTSHDLIMLSIVNGAIYSVPATTANSTVTLPAAAPDGTVAYFIADGSANANTVQYRDATGPTNLTTALTASKRHMVVVSKEGGAWFANAYVSP
jgi:hypothetical protein